MQSGDAQEIDFWSEDIDGAIKSPGENIFTSLYMCLKYIHCLLFSLCRLD